MSNEEEANDWPIEVELTNEQIHLIVKILKEKLDEIEAITKYDTNDLDPQTIMELNLEHRNITGVLREVYHFSKKK